MQLLNLKKQTEKTLDEQKSDVHEYKYKLLSQWEIFLKSGLFVIVALLAASILTFSWYASNKTVSSNSSTILVDGNNESLYIEAITEDNATEHNSLKKTIDAVSLTGKLYPISTIDCQNWYKAGNWNIDESAFDSYVKVNVEQDITNDNRWVYSSEGKIYTAFNLAQYWVYTDDGTLDVYLSPTDAIEVSIDEDLDITDRAQYLKEALRIGIVANDELVMVYAPVSESGTGNSLYAQANKLYAINGTTSSDIISVSEEDRFYTNISSFQANEIRKGEYEAGSQKLFTATTEGVKLSIYVWLEGTDAQAVRGKSNNASGVNVSMSFVGTK